MSRIPLPVRNIPFMKSTLSGDAELVIAEIKHDGKRCCYSTDAGYHQLVGGILVLRCPCGNLRLSTRFEGRCIVEDAQLGAKRKMEG